MSDGSDGGIVVNLSFRGDNGHRWVLAYPRERLDFAVDAVFSWFAKLDEFGVKEFGAFLAALLEEGHECEILCRCSWPVVSRMLFAVAHDDAVGYEMKVNIMRRLMLAALDSLE